MNKRIDYDDLESFRTPTQRRNDAQIAMVQHDIKRIDSILGSSDEDELKALHVDLDGTYQNLIKNWDKSLWGYYSNFGFNYEYLGVQSLRENLRSMRGKLRGYLLQLSPSAEDILSTDSSLKKKENTLNIATENASDTPIVRANMYDLIKGRKFDIAKEYARIWKFFNTADHIGDHVTPLIHHIDGCLQFFPDSFSGRAITLEDFNDIYGFNFNPPNESVTVDELVSYCEYVITLCNYLWEYADIYFPSDFAEDLRDYLYQTVDSCMDELGFMPVERENITIYVTKDPTVIAVAEIADESLQYDIKSYIHKQTEGDLVRKKTILKYLADDIEPERRKLDSINKTFSSNLFQMLQKFVRHNNDSNQYISGLTDEELEKCYDDIYQMWLLAKMELDNLERKKRVEAVIQNING